MANIPTILTSRDVESEADIVNRALGYAGQSGQSISSLDGSGRIETLSRQHYHLKREVLLTRHRFSFAESEPVALTFVKTRDKGKLRYVYEFRTTDFLKLWEIERPNSSYYRAIRFKVVTDNSDPSRKLVYTEIPNAEGIFTINQRNTATFSPLYIEALCYSIASAFASELTGDTKIASRLQAIADVEFKRAEASDSNESVDYDDPLSEFDSIEDIY